MTTRRGSVTSAAVLDAAMTLFSQRGYHGTALSQIAEALNIRTPSLYNHIESKQQLLETIVGDTLDAILADYALAIAADDDPIEQLRRAVRVYARRHATHRREALIVNRDIANLPEPSRTAMLRRRRDHERLIRALIVKGVKDGRFSVGDPALASFAILEMTVSIARWFREAGNLTADSVADQYTEFAMRIVKFRP